MTRNDLFDVSSIPGIEDLTRAGQVPANPDALEAARAQLDATIAAEPTTRTGAVFPVARSARRRWAYRSLAVAAALALLPLGRIALDTARPDVARVAIAADGSLQCSNGGFAAPIDPRDADLRLLPATLPDGWQLDRIAARWSTSDDPAACRVPALTLVRLDGDRVITGDVTVHGPFAAVDAESFLGSRSTVQVAGDPGLLLDSPDVGFQRWVWTSDERTWVMEAQELSTDEGELVAAGVTTTGSSVDWQPTGDDLGLQVVARRPGPPPTYRSAHLEWYVDLTGPDGRAAHYYVSYQPEHPTLALEAAHPGVVVSADGTEARFDRPGAAEADQITIWRDGLTISSGSGPMFVNTTDPAPASAPYEVLTAIVDSLTPVPADDPRLTEHALDEDTVTHP
jgi:hypothetical protein